MKYYILKRNGKQLMNDYLADLSKEKREQVEKRLNENENLLLIEKTVLKDEIGTSEHYTNLWTIGEGCAILWEKYTKKRLMYDYTGIVHPLIHLNGQVQTFEQYTASKQTN